MQLLLRLFYCSYETKMGKRKFLKMRRKWVKGPPENETKMGKIKQDKRLTPDYYYKEK